MDQWQSRGVHGENFMAIFTTPNVVIWFSTGTLFIFATLVYVFTMRVVIYDILSMAIIPTLSTSIMFCNLCYILLWILPRSVVKIAIRIYQILQHWYTQIKLIHCVVIFTILNGDYDPPHGEFKLICKGKFSRRTWVNFTQQFGKNRQRCQQNKFYYAVWQLFLYYYREFPAKILSVYKAYMFGLNQTLVKEICTLMYALYFRVQFLFRFSGPYCPFFVVIWSS